MNARDRSSTATANGAGQFEIPVELPRARLESMRRAAAEVLECEHEVRAQQSNVVAQVLRGSETFYEYDHYPDSDVFDPRSHAQYYYHAHRGSFLEHGHFHLFLRREGMPQAMMPAALPGKSRSRKQGDPLCHLIAISMNEYGIPVRLFTVNRWVTDETWYQGSDIVGLLDRFSIDPNIAPTVVNRWVRAMVQLFWPQITVLIAHRDQVITAWRARHPRRNALEDRRLEVTSYLEISVLAQIDSVARALAANRNQPNPAGARAGRVARMAAQRARPCRTVAQRI